MRGRFRASCLAGLLACTAAAAAQPRMAVDGEGLSPAEQAATRELVAAAMARLPPRIADGLGREVALRWRDDLPEQVHGRARNGRIGLDRRLLAGWMARDPADDRDPGTRIALATLLHELAHVFDRSPAGGLSRDPRLLDLAGWPVRPLRLGLRTGRNDFRDRSPDPYELASPAEFLAVNLEHFLLDPEYACRRPDLHRYFVARLGTPPSARGADCDGALPLVAAGNEGAGLQLLAVDPARVAGVDYLLAEADASPMSRWGHGMLRLVVCAPGRAPGPDCRLDLEHHLVLSFRAFVDEVQVSNWRGLTGGYPSRLFVLPLAQVVDEYTRVELRGLRSVPLRLAPEEVARLLERAARVHWSYDGRYRFVGNNCAVEAWKLLNDALPGRDGPRLRSITPSGLLRRLERAGIADASVLDDEAEALRLGHRFDSLARHFGEMYAVASAELALPARNADAWLRLDPAVRGEWLVRGGLRATAALLVLEEAALRQEQARARETLRRRYRRDGEGDGTVEALLQALWSDGAGAGRPAVLLPGPGYGLPQEAERELLATRVAEVDARLRAAHAGLYETALAWLPERQRRRLRDAEGNLERIGERLRALAATAPD
ncbi:uncharacterized protein DUF4105 [Luteimonas sp. J16]|uniref:DUF7844 domain-containing protein n=1 Tax=unclassified Luteimonas TaxID=2629088 RepID=UPI0004BCB8F5|nr:MULTISPECIES: DUF4105 domain-containing protein [unclassified Luteimonas]TWG89852.1 uncharacterized protein DUF4105 [Luteimonas sp. J16]